MFRSCFAGAQRNVSLVPFTCGKLMLVWGRFLRERRLYNIIHGFWKETLIERPGVVVWRSMTNKGISRKSWQFSLEIGEIRWRSDSGKISCMVVFMHRRPHPYCLSLEDKRCQIILINVTHIINQCKEFSTKTSLSLFWQTEQGSGLPKIKNTNPSFVFLSR